jgi:biotin carboxyl carrier protein
MAMIERTALRVTMGEAVRDVDPGVAGELEITGPGTAILRSAEGPRRVLWAVRRPAGEASHEPLGESNHEPLGDGSGSIALELVIDGWRFEATVELAARAQLRERARRGAGSDRTQAAYLVRAPIPGRIGSVQVVAGQAVQGGETLLTLEAMKMENVVRAPRAGTIGRVAVGAGQTVELGDVLVELA